MKNKKAKTICVLLSLLMLALNISAIPFNVYAEMSGSCGANGDNVVWSLDENGTITISGEGEMKEYVPDMVTPWKAHMDKIKNVVISEGVTVVGGYTFMNNDSIKTVKIADSVTKIDWFAFSESTALESVEIGKGLTTIWNEAFKGCSSLKKIVLPESLVTIEQGAFENCTSLSEITLHDNITTIDTSAFKNTALVNDKSNYKDGVLYVGKHLIKADVAALSSDYTVKDGTLVIAAGAFNDYNIDSPLKKITIPGSVKTIGSYAFGRCKLLEEIIIENGVLTIDQGAFARSLIEEITIPDSVKTIGAYAFSDCEKLKKINFGKGITDIGYSAFNGCASLEEIDLSNCSANIAPFAFGACIALKSANLGDNTKKIEYEAFRGSSSLENVTIGSGAVDIHRDSFYDTPIFNNESNYENGVLYIGKHLIYAKNSEDYQMIYEVKDGTIDIASSAFTKCNTASVIIVPDSVKYIGQYGIPDKDEYSSKRKIICSSGSYAEAYAKENNILYDLTDKEIALLYDDSYYYRGKYLYIATEVESYTGFTGNCIYEPTIKDHNGKEVTSGYIGTGMVVTSNNVTVTVVIRGDVDGNGKINATDYLMIKRHILNIHSLKDAFFKGADIDGSDSLTATDYIAVKRHILGIYDINSQY